MLVRYDVSLGRVMGFTHHRDKTISASAGGAGLLRELLASGFAGIRVCGYKIWE